MKARRWQRVFSHSPVFIWPRNHYAKSIAKIDNQEFRASAIQFNNVAYRRRHKWRYQHD